MDLDTLQSVQSRERQTDSVQSLQSDFYTATAEFVGELRDRRARAAEVADDPFSDPEVSRLSHDIETAEQTVEAIYERRVGKIVKLASLAAADMAVDDEGLTDEEQDLFETLVAAIESNRGRVMDVLDGGSASGDGEATATDATPASDADGVSAAAAMGDDAAAADGRPVPPEEPAQSDGGASPAGADADASSGTAPGEAPDRIDADVTPDQIPPAEATADRPGPAAESGDEASPPDGPGGKSGDETADEPRDPAADGGRIDRRTVQVTDEVGEIFGVDDRTYDLGTGDVVTLPEPNADILVDGDEAVPID
ncbi:hypothetical protein [Halococcoides cellulosivorans]|uniref:DNA replication factor GINS n=1 Tax=Halococcoides cellulosivorans TaxID=1679096 RepID=A0A2R4WXN5_9EURY|nr:hypothetical protein [Halococcoides cellulosivorans]AWB26303.1 hypothetical protein HARCEL1_00500 [Halococcoides cellulosivorans]